jgi:hypothetical protein
MPISSPELAELAGQGLQAHSQAIRKLTLPELLSLVVNPYRQLARLLLNHRLR